MLDRLTTDTYTNPGPLMSATFKLGKKKKKPPDRNNENPGLSTLWLWVKQKKTTTMISHEKTPKKSLPRKLLTSSRHSCGLWPEFTALKGPSAQILSP